MLHMSSENLKWYKLDNSAQLYPVMTTLNAQSIYRLSASLDEEVQPETLQRAIARTLVEYPTFNVRLRRGVFWYYFEENTKPPVVIRDSGLLLEQFVPRRINDFLFRTSYYDNRVSVDFFHVLTDGTGASQFFLSLMANYERERGNLADDNLFRHTPKDTDSEDGFLKYYAPEKLKKLDFSDFLGVPSHKIGGEWFSGIGYGLVQGKIRTTDIIARAKEQGVSLTAYIAAQLVLAIVEANKDKGGVQKPVNIMVPVNLRKPFPSTTMQNFVLFVSLKILPQEGLGLADYCRIAAEQLTQETSEENLQRRLNVSVKGMNHPVFRLMPLALKWFFMKLGKLFVRGGAQTMIFSNIGRLDCKELSLADVSFTLNVSHNSAKNVSTVSAGDYTVISFSRIVKQTEEEMHFFRALAAAGIEVEVQSNLRERKG